MARPLFCSSVEENEGITRKKSHVARKMSAFKRGKNMKPFDDSTCLQIFLFRRYNFRNIEITLLSFLQYSQNEKKPDSFDQFLGWANVILSDFNEMDAHLVDVKTFFDFQFSFSRSLRVKHICNILRVGQHTYQEDRK